MAAFFKILSNLIPWTDVIKSAPAILSAARDLIDRAPKPSEPSPEPQAARLTTEETIRLLKDEIARLRAEVAELRIDSHRQAEVIARLAEQADSLAGALAVTRKRLRAAVWIVMVVAVFAAACLVVLFVR